MRVRMGSVIGYRCKAVARSVNAIRRPCLRTHAWNRKGAAGAVPASSAGRTQASFLSQWVNRNPFKVKKMRKLQNNAAFTAREPSMCQAGKMM